MKKVSGSFARISRLSKLYVFKRLYMVNGAGIRLSTSFNLVVVVTPRALLFRDIEEALAVRLRNRWKGESWKTNGRGEYIQQQD